MCSLVTIFLTTLPIGTAIYAATGLPIAYEAHAAEFIARAAKKFTPPMATRTVMGTTI